LLERSIPKLAHSMLSVIVIIVVPMLSSVVVCIQMLLNLRMEDIPKHARYSIESSGAQIRLASTRSIIS
jgi:hypothetical protein